jgi:RNA polymerase sigma-32 factor
MACLHELPEREAYIVKNRMLTETPATLEEIGAKYDISRERVRQIEKKAFDHLSELFKEKYSAAA